MMKIIAKAIPGSEFIYQVQSAHKVSSRSAEKICGILNSFKYGISDKEVWHSYDIDEYDRAFAYAECQEFKIRKGLVQEIRY